MPGGVGDGCGPWAEETAIWCLGLRPGWSAAGVRACWPRSCGRLPAALAVSLATSRHFRASYPRVHFRMLAGGPEPLRGCPLTGAGARACHLWVVNGTASPCVTEGIRLFSTVWRGGGCGLDVPSFSFLAHPPASGRFQCLWVPSPCPAAAPLRAWGVGMINLFVEVTPLSWVRMGSPGGPAERGGMTAEGCHPTIWGQAWVPWAVPAPCTWQAWEALQKGSDAIAGCWDTRPGWWPL